MTDITKIDLILLTSKHEAERRRVFRELSYLEEELGILERGYERTGRDQYQDAQKSLKDLKKELEGKLREAEVILHLLRAEEEKMSREHQELPTHTNTR